MQTNLRSLLLGLCASLALLWLAGCGDDKERRKVRVIEEQRPGEVIEESPGEMIVE